MNSSYQELCFKLQADVSSARQEAENLLASLQEVSKSKKLSTEELKPMRLMFLQPDNVQEL